VLIKNLVLVFFLCLQEVLAYIVDVSDLFNRVLYRAKNGEHVWGYSNKPYAKHINPLDWDSEFI
jgi:hypothetical protein